jgi:D-3-phosphoglycerate dehydrogenase
VTYKILVSDKIFEEGIKLLEQKGYLVTHAWDIPKTSLPQIISEYDVLIVRSATKVKGELLENAKNLKSLDAQAKV